MIHLKIKILKLFTILIVLTSNNFAKEVKPLEFVDDKRFSGLWYEIARTFNSFEKNCVAPTVEYTLEKPLQYDVTNRCFEFVLDGEMIIYNGTAQSRDGKSMAQIKKTYFWIFSKDYNIYYLDDEYQSAVMSDKEFDSLWIIHRKPTMKKDTLNEILEFLSPHMKLEELIYPEQALDGRYKND